MSVIFAMICGMIQGAAEFLPISSSGHLALFEGIFCRKGAGDLLAFNVALHLGTLGAVLIVYGREIFPLIPAFFKAAGKAARGRLKFAECSADERMALAVFLGTLPMGAAKLFDDRVGALSSYVWAVGVILMINAAALWFSDRLPRGALNGDGIGPRDALTVGAAQCLAVLPGLSRSGTSIAAGLYRGFDRSFAVRYSFILSVPAILGAAIFEIPDALREGIPASDVPAYAAGAVTAFLCGICAIRALTRLSRERGFRGFAYYSAAAGAAALILGATGVKFPIF